MRLDGAGAAVLGIAVGIAMAGAGVWWWGLRRMPATPGNQPARIDAGAPIPHVGITLFDPSPDDDVLTAIQQEVPEGLNPSDHGRLVMEAAIERAASLEVGLLPAGTALRTFFLTPEGEAIIDLTGLAPEGLGGSTTGERLAVQSLVSAVAANLRSARSVRFLLDGHVPAATPLHLDLRNALAADRRALRAP